MNKEPTINKDNKISFLHSIHFMDEISQQTSLPNCAWEVDVDILYIFSFV